jgi:glycine hydroxymethyltransferase
LDLRPKGITGAEAEKALEAAGISVNKNTIPGDTSALKPSGIRIGTSAITSRGLKPADMKQVSEFIVTALEYRTEYAELKRLKGEVATYMRQSYSLNF